MEVAEKYCEDYQIENMKYEVDYINLYTASLYHGRYFSQFKKNYYSKHTDPCFIVRIPSNKVDIRLSDFIIVNSDIRIDLIENSVYLSRHLRHISQAVEQSKYIPDLEIGWDDENADRIESELWRRTVMFLCSYAQYIFKNFDRILEPPEINPCKDGSIDLSWRTAAARMLINIRHTGQDKLAYYYGDMYNNKQPNKGWVNLNPIEPSLALWMKNLSR